MVLEILGGPCESVEQSKGPAHSEPLCHSEDGPLGLCSAQWGEEKPPVR